MCIGHAKVDPVDTVDVKPAIADAEKEREFSDVKEDVELPLTNIYTAKTEYELWEILYDLTSTLCRYVRILLFFTSIKQNTRQQNKYRVLPHHEKESLPLRI